MGLFPVGDPKYDAIYAEEAAMVDASELIAAALEASGMSQADLARALNVSRSEVTARLGGQRNLTVKSLAATLYALGAELKLSSGSRADSAVRKEDHKAVEAYTGWVRPKLNHVDGRKSHQRLYEVTR